MENRETNYWCYRVDKNNLEFFRHELYEGRLRQGWGWDEGQDLRNFEVDEGAGRNRRMFDWVKKGDILLVPYLPEWGDVALVEATEDWNTGYQFEIDSKLGDYGHTFPAKYLKKFTRGNENVTGNLRSTLRNPSRFWNINHYAEDVQKLMGTEVSELSKIQDHGSRLENSIGKVFNQFFNEGAFSESLYQKLNEQFTSEEWEFALVHGLKQLFPFYQVERVGGVEEAHHGTDILIRLPGVLTDYQYGIAIQVKDYSGFVGESVFDQIDRADKYWERESLKLIDKILIVTKTEKDHNTHLHQKAKERNIRLIFAKELEQIFLEIGKSFLFKKAAVAGS